MGQGDFELSALVLGSSLPRGTAPVNHPTTALGLADSLSGRSLNDAFDTSWETAWIDLGGEG